MADKMKKESTPPPLLLMQPAGGLTLTPASGSGLLMPVPSNESSLMAPEEEGEADSFVGQSPAQQAPLYFQSPAPTSQPDPFAQVIQPDLSASPAGIRPPAPLPTFTSAPPSSMPSMSSAGPPPPRAMGGHNMYRMTGPRQYAPPPAGTYASGPAPTMTNPLQPPTFPPPLSSSGPPPTTFTPPPPPPSSLNMEASPPPNTGPPPGGIYVTHDVGVPMSSPLGTSPMSAMLPYVPVQHHWFYSRHIELRTVWSPFSMIDSMSLEDAFQSTHQDNLVISVEGGRYDVDVRERSRTSVFWEEAGTEVRRCSWFYRPEGDTRFVPYDEDYAAKLEDEYQNALKTQVWHKPLEFPGGDTIVMHSPQVIVQFQASAKPDEWGTAQGDQARPRVVKRGIDDFESIEEGEGSQVDHVVFVVHGIGSTCDLRFRNIVECVDDFRSISSQILQSHFSQHRAEGRVGRVEFLPVRWHAALHGDATGVDKRLKAITLNSIGKLRHFTNDTLLDILFYASPAYCQQIADTVGSEINRLHELFMSRNPGFSGQASVAGHSLGTLILFDLLSHQGDSEESTPTTPQPGTPGGNTSGSDSRESTPNVEVNGSEEVDEGEDVQSLEQLLHKLSLADYIQEFQREKIDLESLSMCEDSDMKEMGIPLGPRKKLQGYLREQKQKQVRRKAAAERRSQQAAAQQAQKEAERAAQEQQQQMVQQQAASHPLLRQASSTSVNYVVSGKGIGSPLVKYPKLTFQPAHFFALGSPIAMFLTVRGVNMLGEEFRLPTCGGFYNIFHPFDPVAYRMEPLVSTVYPPKPVLMPHHKGRKRLHLELRENIARMGADIKQKIMDSVKSTWRTLNEFAASHWTTQQEVEQEVEQVMSSLNVADDPLETGSIASSVMEEEEIPIGQLNQGRRIDYVLQEKPIESFNDYLFALGSHACYWESEDTVLLILKEIYHLMGLSPQRPGQAPKHPPFPYPPPVTNYSHPPPLGSFQSPSPAGASGPGFLPGHPTSVSSSPATTNLGAPAALNIGPPPSAIGSPPATIGMPPPVAMGPPPMSGFMRQTPK